MLCGLVPDLLHGEIILIEGKKLQRFVGQMVVEGFPVAIQDFDKVSAAVFGG
jgi:hypothetical protein